MQHVAHSATSPKVESGAGGEPWRSNVLESEKVPFPRRPNLCHNVRLFNCGQSEERISKIKSLHCVSVWPIASPRKLEHGLHVGSVAPRGAFPAADVS